MMKFLSHLDDGRSEPVRYESTVTVSSSVRPGVEYTIRRLSFSRRMDLARLVLELSRRMEFRDSGDTVDESIEANILGCEIDKLYLCWGVVGLLGLTIDGMDATPELLADKGPEDLAREIVAAVKAQCGLTEHERKN